MYIFLNLLFFFRFKFKNRCTNINKINNIVKLAIGTKIFVSTYKKKMVNVHLFNNYFNRSENNYFELMFKSQISLVGKTLYTRQFYSNTSLCAHDNRQLVQRQTDV